MEEAVIASMTFCTRVAQGERKSELLHGHSSGECIGLKDAVSASHLA